MATYAFRRLSQRRSKRKRGKIRKSPRRACVGGNPTCCEESSRERELPMTCCEGRIDKAFAEGELVAKGRRLGEWPIQGGVARDGSSDGCAPVVPPSLHSYRWALKRSEDTQQRVGLHVLYSMRKDGEQKEHRLLRLASVSASYPTGRQSWAGDGKI